LCVALKEGQVARAEIRRPDMTLKWERARHEEELLCASKTTVFVLARY
jgi:hypothetical protein